MDLELDLYKSSDGTLGVFDEDEFDTALGEGLISDQERRKCLDTAAQLLARLGTDDPVLDRLAWSRLEAAVAVDLPAITKP